MQSQDCNALHPLKALAAKAASFFYPPEEKLTKRKQFTD